MPQDIGVFTREGAKKVAEATRRVMGGPQSVITVPHRPARTPPGGGCSCITVYEIFFEGSVTGGTLDLDVGVWDGSSTTTETLTLNYDDTRSEVQTEFETHSEIASGDIDVKGGPLPDAGVYVIFKSSGDRNYDQPLPAINSNSLTGTGVVVKFRYMANNNWEQ